MWITRKNCINNLTDLTATSFLLSFFLYSKDLIFFFLNTDKYMLIYFNREIVLSSSYFISHNMSTAQLSQACFPLSHWDQASSILGIPQLTLTQQVTASVLYTVSHLRREQLSSLHHHESPFSNRKQLCTCKAWFAMCRNPSQQLKRQLPKSKCQLVAWRSSFWSHPTCTGSPTKFL